MIDEGGFKNIDELANVLGIDSGAVARTIRLTLLSSKIIHKIIAGEVKLLQKQYRQSFLGGTGKFFLFTVTSKAGDCGLFSTLACFHVSTFVIRNRSVEETALQK